ncbi:DnaJ C-terminal domain-containing protein [Acinetobacter johnsonii]|uniref:Curved DNA-binding protein n=1 Tax=Acinetobacter johnsonii TaxID=40214 RepID=A0A1R7Q9W4_ACIJO|nr:DnaJ C-terminal domain-containing protein [Acinetobacter johnsonii]SJX21049.1 Curved DNA-binding protein [Acinetobacter johnsonii]
MPKNHYEILGLTRDATAEQIKKAYRKLARKYHPDVSKEPDAEARMQELNVAYDTLSDETKKAEYDFELDHPQGSQQFNPNAGFGGFEEAFRNAQGGQQAHDFSGFEDLFGRFGSGFGGSNYQYQRQNSTRHKGEDQHARLEVDLEVGFHGTTQTITLQIPTLSAYGEAEIQRKTLEVKIPKGMKEGQQIRLSGQGQSGIQGGENGDLYIEIYYKDTETTRVEGVDVYHQLNISPWEAALGQSITAALPNGRTLQIQIPKNAKTGQQLRLKDQGIPAKTAGHLYLILNIVQPPAQSEQEQQAYQAFAEAFPHFKPRQS